MQDPGNEHTQRTTLRGAELAWEQAGTGSPSLIWGHGLSSSRADENDGGLLDFVPLRKEHRVVRYDARGHGESQFTVGVDGYNWEELAKDQLALADHLELPHYVAGGASMGAATALHAAVMAPERTTALVLMIPPTAWETRAAQTDLYETMAQIVETHGVEPLIAGAAEMAPPDPFVGRSDWRDRRAAAMRAADPQRLAGVFRGATVADLPPREKVAQLTTPVLILAWTGDPGHPVSSAEELHSLLPQSTVVLASTWDEMQAWTGHIAAFLQHLR